MKKMKILRLARLFIVFAILIFEILPYGAVCVFATPEETFRRCFSYFSLTPYGYANFAPLITAILSCVLLVLSILSLFFEREGIEKSARWLSLAAVISLAPLMLGVRFFSVVGAIISVLLWSVALMSFPWRSENEK